MANNDSASSSTLFEQAQTAGGNHFLLFEPTHFSINGIRIAAQCTFEEIKANYRTGVEPVRSSSDHAIHSISSQSHIENDALSSLASSSRPTSNFPPSSFRDPLAGRDVSKVRRPRSAEIGARAKGAMMEFGRVARELQTKGLYGLRNLSRSDVSESRESQMIIAPSMNDLDDLIAISSPQSSTNINQRRSSSQSETGLTPSESLLFPTKAQQDGQDGGHRSNVKSILRVRRLYRLRPCSTSVGGDVGKGGQIVPISISNRTEARFASVGGEDSGWERLEGCATEYMADIEQPSTSNELLHRSRDTSEGQASSDMDSTQEYKVVDGSNLGNTDPQDVLLLKVNSPIATFAQIAGPERMANGWRDEVVLKMRLQVKAKEIYAESRPLSPSSLKPTPLGPRKLSSSYQINNGSNERQIIFLSCNSAQKLCEAIENEFTGPLCSQSSAKLEGIDWVPVQEINNAKPIDFEWTWKDSSSSHSRDEYGNETQIKCACAFILIDQEKNTMQRLAFFQFMINKLSASQIIASSQLTTIAIKNSQSLPNGVNHQEELFNGRAIGLGLEGVDAKNTARSPKSSFGWKQSNSENLLEQQKSAKSRPSKSSVVLPSSPTQIPRQLSQSEQLFASPSIDVRADTAPFHFSASDLNHVEIGLEDMETDSPIYRAALQNVEKRTVNLKRVAKGMLKAADDVSHAIEELQVTEVRLDHTFEDMAGLMPATFARLSNYLLFKSREAERERREQAIAMLEVHVIMPMRAVTDMCRELIGQLKAFESESKAYYSATQKWLSSKSSAAQNISSIVGNEYSADAIGFDKAMIKQEKSDEKQKWRQLRFDLSRFEMYRSVCSLHEGEAELLIASHMLSLCRWQCKDLSQESIFRNFDMMAQREMVAVKAKAESALEKCLEIERKLADHHRLMLSRENEGQMGIEPSPIPEISADNQLGIATKHASNKFKSLLTSIGVGHSISPSSQNISSSVRQPFSCPIPPASSFDVLDTDSPSKQPHKQPSLDPKSPTGSMTVISPSMPISGGNKWQSRLRTFSFTKSPNMQESERKVLIETNLNTQPYASQASNNKASVPDVNVVVAEGTLMEQTPTRKTSLSAKKPSPSKSPMALDMSSLISSKSPNERPLQLRKFDIQSPTLSTPSDGATTEKSLLGTLPSSTQPQRKKEGILWTMTKPIQGLGSSDAPKSVSRSQNWRESWVVLSGSGHLGEYAHWKDSKGMTLVPSQPLIDLRFATVREARGVERRFTFEVITRESRRFYQASNDENMQEWIGAISFAIESLINGTSSVRQIDKVARNSAAQAVDSFGLASPSTLQEFGDGMRHVLDHAISPTSNSIGVHKSFSQSLTDLSSAASGRLFNRYGGNVNQNGNSANREEFSKSKRESRNLHNNFSRGHLLALSEGGHSTSNDQTEIDPSTPLKGVLRHSRGISNNTPVSGYILGTSGGGVTNQASDYRDHLNIGSNDDGKSLSTSSLNVYSEFDKRIEQMIHTNYGGESSSINEGSGFHSQTNSANRNSIGNTFSSSAASRVPSSVGQSSVDEEGRLFNNMALENNTNKVKRAQEIMSIASLPQNRTCADCCRPDPRWASWSLNGTPCCIFICIACSGVHRGLGVSVSKVRSVDLDDWSDQQIRAARLWGNERANAIYEARKPIECTVASMGDVRTKAFWITKYVEQAWFSLHPYHEDVDRTVTEITTDGDASEKVQKIGSYLDNNGENDIMTAKVQGSPAAQRAHQKNDEDDVVYRIYRTGNQAETQRWSTKLIVSSSEIDQSPLPYHKNRASLPPPSTNPKPQTLWHSLETNVTSKPNSAMPSISA